MFSTVDSMIVSSSTPRKIRLSPLRTQPRLPDDYFEQSWGTLKSAINDIHSRGLPNYNVEVLYRFCETLCIHNYSNLLYDNLNDVISLHTRNQLSDLQQHITNPDPLGFLTLVDRLWSKYTKDLKLIRLIFLYLDRSLNSESSNVLPIWDLGLSILKEKLMESNELSGYILNSVLKVVEWERDGKSIDRDVVRGVVNMYTELGLYFSYFFPALIKETRTYYSQEGKRLSDSLVQDIGNISPTAATTASSSSALSSINVPQFILHAENRINQEKDRAESYLDPESKQKLVFETQGKLIREHVTRILDLGFEQMMKKELKDDVARLYTLLDAVEKLDVLRIYWTVFIKNTGLKMVNDPSIDSTLVNQILSFKSHLDSFLEVCFQSNPKFQHSLKEAFESFINANKSRPAKLIAKFLDKYLRSGNTLVSDEELNDILDRILVLFRFIHGKDMFEAYYKHDLAIRLLYGNSASRDLEMLVLTKLKKECGETFTTKLEGMLKDIGISGQIMEEFMKSKRGTASGPSFNVLTLNRKYWPTYKREEVKLPPDLEKLHQQFEEKYKKKNDHKKLTWLPQLGTAVIHASFLGGKKELFVTQYQALVLNMFRSQDIYTYESIKEVTGMPDDVLKKTLLSLSGSKAPIIHRVSLPPPKTEINISNQDEFQVNYGFTYPSVRVVLYETEQKEKSGEEKHVEAKVHLDRNYKLDAVIVKIMKVNKTLQHSELINKVLSDVKYLVTVPEVKKRLESIIDREFIERDENDPNILKYVP